MGKKKTVSSSNLLLPTQEILLRGDALKGQRVMLIKGKFLVFFYPDFLGRKFS
jgi:hypothetical protein